MQQIYNNYNCFLFSEKFKTSIKTPFYHRDDSVHWLEKKGERGNPIQSAVNKNIGIKFIVHDTFLE